MNLEAHVSLAGVRPTVGGIHLGHYVGNIEPTREREAGGWETFFMLADLHEAAESCVEVEQAVLQMVADVLA